MKQIRCTKSRKKSDSCFQNKIFLWKFRKSTQTHTAHVKFWVFKFAILCPKMTFSFPLPLPLLHNHPLPLLPAAKDQLIRWFAGKHTWKRRFPLISQQYSAKSHFSWKSRNLWNYWLEYSKTKQTNRKIKRKETKRIELKLNLIGFGVNKLGVKNKTKIIK